MKEGDPLYGTVYHVGDYLPDEHNLVVPMMNGKLSSNKILETELRQTGMMYMMTQMAMGLSLT